MAEPSTSASLLWRIRDCEDTDAWRQFGELYAPLVYRFARKYGLQDADAADLTQEVLEIIAGGAERFHYDPERGSFRGWLYQVTRNELYKFLRRQKNHPIGTGDTKGQILLEQHPASNDGERCWNREYRQRLFAWAAKQVRGEFRDSTWQAFWQTAVKGCSGKVVAQELGMSIGAVYVAKSRILTRLKEKIEQVQCEHETQDWPVPGPSG